MDDPTATPSGYKRSNAVSLSAQQGGEDSDGEDEAPDYLRLMSTLNSKSKSSSAASSSGIVIPKRGEKDFEPTGFGGQSKLLERSREAMFQAVSGERRVGSRSLVRATWDAKTCRARLLDVQGKIFETVGVIRREQVKDEATGKVATKAWNELLPEEALFLAERGSLQIYERAHDDAEALVPMSLQQAFAALMQPPIGGKGEDEPLTREAYLIYAYLKRLGYVVQRASIVDAVRAAPISASALAKKNSGPTVPFDGKAKTDGIIADPQRPIKLVTIWDIFLYVPRRIAQLAGDAASAVARWLHKLWQNTVAKVIASVSAATRKALGGRAASRANVGSLGLGLGLGAGQHDGRRFLGEKGTVKWDSYDAVFSSLQIVPSGHDFWLPSDSSSTPTLNVQQDATMNASIQQTIGSETRSQNDHLKPFYYAWRPATLYRKSHPPPPEFRIVILNARTTPVPSVWQFESIFAQIPIPGSDQELFGAASSATAGDVTGQGAGSEGGGMSEHAIKERLEYEKKLKASNEAKNRAAYGKFSEGSRSICERRLRRDRQPSLLDSSRTARPSSREACRAR